ncbi:molybdate ABC transporter substrate-binding protein [Aestuariirhabdus litorea]|uniref:Molybdate ABC transporter substrate-binding protein n=1 Tax=Aestuariirhabdus litorea TaxID=2528527 RepID=A0A3P3VJM7_9GAMM|nr:molybdate ABC transporter substrate-binding protein [Aestuariirhabdus litorea]RRJ82915.1 molybdate ABC transporter substrate-binding protein [Aestuariirhabdus litorea]RWW93074.1 molybdate ABC transporter substrate-binding protein [Endozoicomonadaceae bacterium GTF-13]
MIPVGYRPLLALLLVLCWAPPLSAAEVRVAVASNFMGTAQRLAEDFERHSGHRLLISYGSTGKLYTQIYHGAPFDLFLAADAERPRRAELEGLAVSGSRITYATGQLALWSPRGNPFERLTRGEFRRLAIANPDTAPYGFAAREVIGRLVASGVQQKLVYGENISQTHQFVASGNAELGFVALSQLQQERPEHLWLVPANSYPPIEQQAVLLTRGQGSEAARDFLTYLQGERATAIIIAGGYLGPGEP